MAQIQGPNPFFPSQGPFSSPIYGPGPMGPGPFMDPMTLMVQLLSALSRLQAGWGGFLGFPGPWPGPIGQPPGDWMHPMYGVYPGPRPGPGPGPIQPMYGVYPGPIYPDPGPIRPMYGVYPGPINPNPGPIAMYGVFFPGPGNGGGLRPMYGVYVS
ncbi:MAG: hypothetical protein HY319_25690 [Armatimonadetes bacterium]|nr:hypothetical protein [Armatimonadota bacterium]